MASEMKATWSTGRLIDAVYHTSILAQLRGCQAIQFLLEFVRQHAPPATWHIYTAVELVVMSRHQNVSGHVESCQVIKNVSGHAESCQVIKTLSGHVESCKLGTLTDLILSSPVKVRQRHASVPNYIRSNLSGGPRRAPTRTTTGSIGSANPFCCMGALTASYVLPSL